MRWNHFLPYLLLLSYSFHHHAIAKFGNLGKLLKGNSGQRRYTPLRDETLEESSSQGVFIFQSSVRISSKIIYTQKYIYPRNFA
jgi:hypothetical protein